MIPSSNNNVWFFWHTNLSLQLVNKREVLNFALFYISFHIIKRKHVGLISLLGLLFKFYRVQYPVNKIYVLTFENKIVKNTNYQNND